MNKIHYLALLLAVFFATSEIMAQGRGKGKKQGQGQNQGQGRGQGQGNGQGSGQSKGGGGMSQNEQQIKNMIDSIPIGNLDVKEREGLILMREEEKLAHDVYVVLYQKTSLKPFGNIQRSESRHMLAVKYMLDRYKIPDPVKSNTVGSFQSQKLLQLYNQLVQQGSRSKAEAIKVGLLIEELDIADLRKLLKETDNKDIQLVYQNLLRGSRNHLRAFSRLQSKYNVSYTPQYLSQTDFNQIAQSPQEKGQGNNKGGKGNANNQRGNGNNQQGNSNNQGGKGRRGKNRNSN
jgi:hypothetical protein